jgi:hypothetical protein
MGYTQTLLSEAVTELGIRLGDPSHLWWSSGELKDYIIEALRTWQAHSQFYTTEVNLTLSSGTLLYNLSSSISTLQPTVTDQYIIQLIEEALLEPISLTSWTGSNQFTYQAVVNAIWRARDRFIMETGLAQSISNVPGPTPPADTIDLDDSVVDIRRVVWNTGVSNAGVYSIMWLADQFAMTAASPTWTGQSTTTPYDYSTVLNQPLVLTLMPPPSVVGTVNLITVNSGAVLNPSSGPTILGVPDDFSWVVKYGALATLFGQDGPGFDPDRARYCLSRWRDGIALARITNVVKFGYQPTSGNPSFIDSMTDLDIANPNWVSQPTGAPTLIGISGNIAAVTPVANATLTLPLVVTPPAPIPPTLSDYIQVGVEALDGILDYAQHLASLKEGADVVQDTLGFYKSFVQLAGTFNDKIVANSIDFDILSDRTMAEEKMKPRLATDLDKEGIQSKGTISNG